MRSASGAPNPRRPDVSGRSYLKRIAEPRKGDLPPVFAPPRAAPEDTRPPAAAWPVTAQANPLEPRSPDAAVRRAPAASPAPPAPLASAIAAAARPAATVEAFSPTPMANPPPVAAIPAETRAVASPVPRAVVFPAADIETPRPDTSRSAPGPTLAAPASEPLQTIATPQPAPSAPPDREAPASSAPPLAPKEVVAVASLPPVSAPIAVGGPTAARAPDSPAPASRAAGAGPRIHIGHVEVRTSPPPAPLPPIAPPPVHIAAQPQAAAAPVSRGYGWRYGLSQS